jgi:hypothetical protein
MIDYSIYAGKSYLRRHESSGTASVAAPSVYVPAEVLYRTAHEVTHGLGYIPQVRVYYEADASDGKIYPAGGRRLSGEYPGLPSNSVYCLWELTTTTLTIYLESATTKTGSRDVYYVIYEDAAS